MARISRSSLPRSGFYHVICRGNNHNILFRNDEDFLAFIDRVIRFQKEWPFYIYHHSLMPTHVHFEVEVEDLKYLSKAFQGIEISYHKHFSDKYKYCGHLWHSRFRTIPIESEDYLISCGRYIELNAPVAGIVQSPEEYRWSSYRYYALGEEDSLLKPASWYSNFGKTPLERRKAYKAFIDEGLKYDPMEESSLFETTTFIGDVSPANQRLVRVCREKGPKNRAK